MKVLFASCFLFVSCGSDPSPTSDIKHSDSQQEETTIIVAEYSNLKTRFNPPDGFHRIECENKTFGSYLQELPLKEFSSKVKLYDGRTKYRNVHESVIDLEIGTKDLQQCADAIMRLRGEYLYHVGRYEAIHFNLTNGFRTDFKKWSEGYRVKVNGNRTWWEKTAEPSTSYETFRNYMFFVFIYAGTLSLSKEMKSVDKNDMQIGNVFIQGGSPGHAVIVVDMAIDNKTGEKLFMLAQSYMPAQDIHILKNFSDKSISPWYRLNDNARRLETPEWNFEWSDLKRFVEDKD